jgi:hypothetical protein
MFQKRVVPLTREHLRNHSFDGRIFADVRCGFVGWDDRRGLSLRGRKNRLYKDEEGETTCKSAHSFIVLDPRSASLAAKRPPSSPARTLGARSANNFSVLRR